VAVFVLQENVRVVGNEEFEDHSVVGTRGIMKWGVLGLGIAVIDICVFILNEGFDEIKESFGTGIGQ